MKIALMLTVALGLIGADAQAAAMFKVKSKFASMSDKEVVVQTNKGKRLRLNKDLIRKSDLDLLTKKSNGKFVTISVLSTAILKDKKERAYQ